MNNNQQKQGSLEQWALLIVLLLLLFWEKVAPSVKGFLCECQNLNDSDKEEFDNTIDLPQTSPNTFGESFEFNKEEFERVNDSNLLNIDPSKLVQSFDQESDTLKITRYGISS